MVKTLGYGCRVQDVFVKRDEDGMEVMHLDDDEDERRNVGERDLLGARMVEGPHRFLSPSRGQLC